MLRQTRSRAVAALCLAGAIAAGARAEPPSREKSPAERGPYARWSNGPGRGENVFPIAVWLQDPKNAPKYQALGVNLYIGLWKGPTAEQIAELKRHGMPVICDQNDYALRHLGESAIVGWMHGDEPDNAQSLGQARGYGPPIAPDKIVEDYRRVKTRDATRPVLLNLGQGVAWDGWYGRGVRTNHPEDYVKYVQGGDIVSFDIYPAVHDKPAVAGKLWYVAHGVERLRGWAGANRIVWNCIECTRISHPKMKPTPQQVKAEVWMSIVHGSRGIVYFCHQFQPRFIEAGLLADPEMAATVRAVNRQVGELAAAINGPAVAEGVAVSVDPPAASAEMARAIGSAGVDFTVRRSRGKTWLFAVRMEAAPAKAAFHVAGLPADAVGRVLGEDRTVQAHNGRFEDNFGPWSVHLYEFSSPSGAAIEFIPEMASVP